MADNDTLPATGDVIRSIDTDGRGVKTQVVKLDVGGPSRESLLTNDKPDETNELLLLMLLELEKITLLLTNR